jgi:anthranilate phosphoribosyltransferase
VRIFFASGNIAIDGESAGDYAAPVLEQLTQQLAAGNPLTADQARAAANELVTEAVSAECKADFLAALARKGETVEEITALAHALGGRSIRPPLDAQTREVEILDVCGTGGDRLNTFNISTTVAIVASAAGVVVAKHGNRAITSQAGSADVLEALGIRIELEPDEAAKWLREHRFAFFFAPKYHPAFKHIAAARKLCAQRGQRTVFNFLGPLLNPVRPSAQLVGVPRAELCEPIARVLQALGVRRGMVVSGRVGDASLDELSTLGENSIAEFYQDRGFSVSTSSPADFPLQPASLASLVGGDREVNAGIVRELLSGKDRGPKRDAVLLNAAAALFVAGKVKSLVSGWELAEEVIDNGRARVKLEELVGASRG